VRPLLLVGSEHELVSTQYLYISPYDLPLIQLPGVEPVEEKGKVNRYADTGYNIAETHRAAFPCNQRPGRS
jgi:hypothetical protein